MDNLVLDDHAMVTVALPVLTWCSIHEWAINANCLVAARHIDMAIAEREGRMVQLTLRLFSADLAQIVSETRSETR